MKNLDLHTIFGFLDINDMLLIDDFYNVIDHKVVADFWEYFIHVDVNKTEPFYALNQKFIYDNHIRKVFLSFINNLSHQSLLILSNNYINEKFTIITKYNRQLLINHNYSNEYVNCFLNNIFDKIIKRKTQHNYILILKFYRDMFPSLSNQEDNLVNYDHHDIKFLDNKVKSKKRKLSN